MRIDWSGIGKIDDQVNIKVSVVQLANAIIQAAAKQPSLSPEDCIKPLLPFTQPINLSPSPSPSILSPSSQSSAQSPKKSSSPLSSAGRRKRKIESMFVCFLFLISILKLTSCYLIGNVK